MYIILGNSVKRRASELSSPGNLKESISECSIESPIIAPNRKRICRIILSDSEDDDVSDTGPDYNKIQEDLAFLSGLYSDIDENVSLHSIIQLSISIVY